MLVSVERRIRVEFGLPRWLRAAASRLAEMRQAIEGRRALARMDARMLSDIGLSLAAAQVEINRRPWDIGRGEAGAERR